MKTLPWSTTLKEGDWIFYKPHTYVTYTPYHCPECNKTVRARRADDNRLSCEVCGIELHKSNEKE